MTHLEKIAYDLEHNTYKDSVHGKIAKDNFIYGAAQAKLEALRVFQSMSIKIINTTQGGEQWRTLKQNFEDALTKAMEE
ncbi:MAG: hypothetical protein MJZ12_00125 [Prevotella sp.]|nr:hypothetical protein [Prevotella sp.]